MTTIEKKHMQIAEEQLTLLVTIQANLFTLLDVQTKILAKLTDQPADKLFEAYQKSNKEISLIMLEQLKSFKTEKPNKKKGVIVSPV